MQAPLCLIGCIVAWWLLGDTERRKNVKFDVQGALSLGVGSVLLLLALKTNLKQFYYTIHYYLKIRH